MLTVTLYYNGCAKIVSLPDIAYAEKNIVLSAMETAWMQDCVLHFFATENIWRLRCPDGMHWNSDTALPLNRVLSDRFNISAEGNGMHFGLYCRTYEREDTQFSKYELQELISIGSENASIVIEDRFISAQHGIILSTANGYAYRDTSKNGSFLNGRVIHNAQSVLQTGDIISFACGVRIVFLGSVCAINKLPCLKGVQLKPLYRPVQIPQADASPVAEPYTTVLRSPHFFPTSKAQRYVLEPVPAKNDDNKQSLLLSLGPSLTMSLPMLAGSFLAGTGAYAKSGIYMMLTSSVLASVWLVANHFYGKHIEKTKYEKLLDDYIHRLANLEHDIEQDTKNEMKRALEMYPSAADCARFVAEKTDNIWRNRPEINTFLEVRLGQGMLPPPCQLELPVLKMGEHPEGIFSAPFEAASRLNRLCRLPVHFSLGEGVPVGIVCSNKLMGFVQGLILQLASLNSYRDMRIAVLGADGSEARWRHLRVLPHTAYEDQLSSHMIATDERSRHTLLEDLGEIWKRSTDRDKENSLHPHYVIFCEDNSLLSDSGFLACVSREKSSFTVCAIANNQKNLPKECMRIIEIEDRNTARFYNSAEGTKTGFTPEFISMEQMYTSVRLLASMREGGMKANDVTPASVGFLESFGCRRIEEMEIWHNWCRNSVSNHIQANIGVRTGSQPFYLDLSDKAHGPHGLVAGTTGSGKSVLLQTLVLALACRYSPTELQFVLIDYKGGGSFDCFKGLPHVVGIVDNLAGKRTILRALASVKGEVLRRQKLFKATNVNDINDYIRLCNPDSTATPLSHIIIIIDEFAELKDEMPSFIEELVSVSRIGRSLGIHLILATQKPSASVSNEIRSNARFRLCLRVQTREDSMEVISHPDAAFLRGMGSAWVQVGNDEVLEKVQTSWNGSKYNPEAPTERELPHVLDNLGRTVRLNRGKKDENCVTEIKALLQEINEIMRRHESDANREKLRVRGRLWLDDLPFTFTEQQTERIFADADASRYPNDICLPFGLLDDVLLQQQHTACLHMTQTPIVSVIGGSTDGKTTLMQALIYSACRNYTPDKLQVCIVSFNGAQLTEFSDYRNVTGIVRGGNVASLRQFLFKLQQEAERRRDVYDQCGATSHVDCVSILKEAAPPSLLIVIDRLGQFMERISDDEQARLTEIMKNAPSYGFYFCITVIDKTELPYALRESVYDIPLCRDSLSEYSLLLKDYRFSPNDLLPERKPGRGMMRVGDRVFEMQCALPMAIQSDNRRREALREYGKTLHIGVACKKALHLVDVPAVLNAATLCAISADMEADANSRAPFALKLPELAPLWMSDYETNVMFVLGKSGTGKTSFLQARAQIHSMQSGGKLFVLCKEDAWNDMNARVLNVSRASGEEWRVWLKALSEELADQVEGIEVHMSLDASGNICNAAVQPGSVLLIMDDMDVWYGSIDLPCEFESCLDSIVNDGARYNASVLCACTIGNTSLLPNDSISALQQRGLGIATGNTLANSNPWYVDVPYSRELEQMRAGEGFCIAHGQAVRIILPGKAR